MIKKLLSNLRPVDRLIAGYQLMMLTTALVFKENIIGWGLAAARHAMAFLAVVSFCTWAKGYQNKLIRLISDWYPVVTLPLVYRWAGTFIHALFPWRLDSLLNGFDSWLLGCAPAKLLQNIHSSWLTDLMQLSYCSFYVLIATSCLILYLKGKKQEFGNLTLSIIMSLYGTYLLFMLLPAHSPRFEFISSFSLDGGWLTGLISTLLKNTAYCGGAFPSGHAAASLAICILMWRYKKWRSVPFIIATAMLLMSTLYGGYHYLADILAGQILGIGAVFGAVIWNRKHLKTVNVKDKAR